MKRLLIHIIILICSGQLFAQQDHLLSQFPYTKLLVNPALAGENDYTSIYGMHRDQWSGIQGAPESQWLGVNLSRVAKNLGFAVSISRHTIGIQEKLDLTGMYAYKVKIGKATASLAMQISGRRFTNDFTKDGLIAIDGFALDPSIERIRYSESVFNAGIGTYIKTDDFYVGISIPRLAKVSLDPVEVDDSKSTEVRHLYGMAGLDLRLSSILDFRPQLLYKLAENAPNDLDLFASIVYKNQFHFGTNLRTGGTQQSFLESVDIILGFQFTDAIFASMAFDFTLSELRQFENGSFELLLRYDFVNNNKPQINISPRFY